MGIRMIYLHDSEVNILILDSATTGRMACLYYRNMDKELYLDRLKNWHSTCVWLHRYRKDENEKFIAILWSTSHERYCFCGIWGESK